jgi:hypothetical protein
VGVKIENEDLKNDLHILQVNAEQLSFDLKHSE